MNHGSFLFIFIQKLWKVIQTTGDGVFLCEILNSLN